MAIPASNLQAEANLSFQNPDEMSIQQEALLENMQQAPVESEFADDSWSGRNLVNAVHESGVSIDGGNAGPFDFVDEEGDGFSGLPPGPLDPKLAAQMSQEQEQQPPAPRQRQPRQQNQNQLPPESPDDEVPRRIARTNIHETSLGDDQSVETESLSSDLLDRARQYGMSDEQARSYSSQEDLERTLVMMDQRAMQQAWNRQQQQQQAAYGYQQQPQYRWQAPPQQYQPQQPPQQQQPQYPQQQVATTPQQEQQQVPDEFRYQFDPDMVDPGTAELLTGMQDHYGRLIQQMSSNLNAVQSRLYQQELAAQQAAYQRQQELQNQMIREFDSAISSLGPEYNDIFGTGSTLELPPNSPQYMNRQRIWHAQELARNQHAWEGRNVPMNSAVQSAAKILFPKQFEQAVRQQVSSQLQGRQQQLISRPTRRNGKQQQSSTRDRALRRMDAWYAANIGEPNHSAIDDGFAGD